MPTLTQQVPLHIRWLIRRDLPQVLAIEQAAYGDAAWTDEDFLRPLRQRNCIGMVAEQRVNWEYPDNYDSFAVRGYMLYELFPDHIHTLTCVVDPAWRHRGVGGRMVAKLVGKLSGHRRTRLVIDASEADLGSCLFLRRQRFLATGVLPGQGRRGEDCYRFEYALEPGEQMGPPW